MHAHVRIREVFKARLFNLFVFNGLAVNLTKYYKIQIQLIINQITINFELILLSSQLNILRI